MYLRFSQLIWTLFHLRRKRWYQPNKKRRKIPTAWEARGDQAETSQRWPNNSDWWIIGIINRCLLRVTLPETNIEPEKRPFQKEISSSNHGFSGAMLVSGRVSKECRRCTWETSYLDGLGIWLKISGHSFCQPPKCEYWRKFAKNGVGIFF